MKTLTKEINISADVETWKTEIAKVQNMKDVVSILRKIDKIEDLVAIDNDNLGRLNHSGEIRVRIARRAGEIIANLPKNRGGRKKSDGSTEQIPTYEERGIDPMQASRWQRIYAIPVEVFELHITKLKEDAQPITDAHFIDLYNERYSLRATIDTANYDKSIEPKDSGEKVIDKAELKKSFKYECPYCKEPMTKLNKVKSVNPARKEV